jgi:rhodanese-related sulfurtransferase
MPVRPARRTNANGLGNIRICPGLPAIEGIVGSIAEAARSANQSSPLSPVDAPNLDADAVTVGDARARAEAGTAILIDIREPQEHATGVAACARLLPMSQLNQRWHEIPTDPNTPVLLICRTQNRSAAVMRALRGTGRYGHVCYVDGGMSEWARRGWPMVRPGG